MRDLQYLTKAGLQVLQIKEGSDEKEIRASYKRLAQQVGNCSDPSPSAVWSTRSVMLSAKLGTPADITASVEEDVYGSFSYLVLLDSCRCIQTNS